MIGRTLSHYKILRKLPSGGMGDVYLAVETETCDMTRLLGIDLPRRPLLAHFAERIDVVGRAPRPF